MAETSVKYWEIINFKKFSDGRGDLVPLEFGSDYPKSDIPFEVKRCYYISAPTNSNNAVRGKHSHHNLEQVIICVHGSFSIYVEDNIGNSQSFTLSENNKALHIKKGYVWRELKEFSPNCVVLVLASEHYNANDYIIDYEEFKKCK